MEEKKKITGYPFGQKNVNLKQIANAYGIHRKTFSNDLHNYDECIDELEECNWDGRKFYPIHQDIIIKYFGEPLTKEKHA